MCPVMISGEIVSFLTIWKLMCEFCMQVAKKHFSLTSMITGKSNYGVLVSPNVDQAFVSAVVTIMEAIHNENKEKHSGKHSD